MQYTRRTAYYVKIEGNYIDMDLCTNGFLLLEIFLYDGYFDANDFVLFTCMFTQKTL